MTAALAESRLESGTEITAGARHLWLAERRRSLGASDLSAVVGADPYRTALDVFMDKTGQAEPTEETFPMWFGTRMEPVLAEAYERETGHAIPRRQVFARAAELPWMTATLDGIRDDGRIVEFKTVNARNRDVLAQLGEAGTDEIPVAWVWQLTHQMIVWEDTSADLAVLVGGGDFRVYTVKLHPTLSGHAIRRGSDFWRLVEARTPPPPSSADDIKHYTALYREAVGEVELPGEIADHVAVYETLGRDIRDASRLRDLSKLAILDALKSAELGRLPNGRTVRRKLVSVAAHEVKASEQVRLYLSKETNDGQE